MADIRSLLRSELASRKGSPRAENTGRVAKRRRIDSSENLAHKRIRSTDIKESQQQLSARSVLPPSAQAIAEGKEGIEDKEEEVSGPELPPEIEAEGGALGTGYPVVAPDISKDLPDTSQSIDEDEWAAFERDVAAPTRVPKAPAAIIAEATIVAAPISVGDLAAQQQREKEEAARARETEIEGEREDAARLIEDEFEEMEHLEERVQRLKEKREELRKKRASGENVPMDVRTFESNRLADDRNSDGNSGDDDDSDSDWDEWTFR